MRSAIPSTCCCPRTVRMRRAGCWRRCSGESASNTSRLGGCGIARDVTARIELEERLRQTQKLESLAVLAGGVAHDFNNLLVPIMGNASLAIESLPALDPARPLLNEVIQASERASNLTR